MIIMKIAYVLSSTNPVGGATKAVKTMLSGLMKLGVEPVIILPDKEGIYGEFKAMGMTVYALNYKLNIYPGHRTLRKCLEFAPRILMKVVLNNWAAGQLATILEKERVQIVHTNVGVINIGFKAARKARLPHIYHIREYADLDFDMHVFPSKKHFQQQLNAPQSYSLCITRDIQRHHRQTGKATSLVVYDGIKPATQQMPCVGKKPYLLYAGRIEPAKGLMELLQAYALYRQASKEALPLHIAGSIHDAGYWQQAQQYIEEQQMQAQVKYLGLIPNIEQLMMEAQAIVIPSRFEGFGLCMPEAMFCGCLAIGRNTGGTKEQLDNGKQLQGSDIALRYDTIEELAQLLSEVAHMPLTTYRQYTERAFNTVNKLYTEEKNAHDIFQLYQDILQSPRL